MKLQVAIDRVTLEQAKRLVAAVRAADVIEIGTSLTKDYGLPCTHQLVPHKGNAKLLADIKTIDEGAYEFKQYFEAGADILTVMGASAIATLDSCYEVTNDYGREMMIDLLECTEEKIAQISHYENAIYCIHFASDAKKEQDVVEAVNNFRAKFPEIRKLALAGGLDKEGLKRLKETELDLAIVGGSVTKAENPQAAVEELLEVLAE